ncbi:MAG: beta-N-acetylhexosaminidase, partial [Verrucomicrobiota bacterium]
MKLLPCPRFLKRGAGFFFLPRRAGMRFSSELSAAQIQSVIARLKPFGMELSEISAEPAVRAIQSNSAPRQPGGYTLQINPSGVEIRFGQLDGLHAAIATLRQLLREHGRTLPFLSIRDWPDFPRRGVMLDISRGRVPKLETLLELVDHLADFKINEFQLYTEHTFAYRRYRSVWRSWGALTGKEIQQLDQRCRELGIDLVPNQNSFGHLREFLAHPPLQKLAEVSEPYPSADGDFLRYPSTLAPNHAATLPFLRGLYDELLPHFSSALFNVGCDETWDLGRGQSRKLCEHNGKARVYLKFLKKIQREVSSRGKRMMFWGDIVLNHPELIRELPRDLIALNWGYEADHPFAHETALFRKAGIPFYVCPGTSTWMTLIGRHDNALANLRSAAEAGRKNGAIGYLITDWGDGGHPQPLA